MDSIDGIFVLVSSPIHSFRVSHPGFYGDGIVCDLIDVLSFAVYVKLVISCIQARLQSV